MLATVTGAARGLSGRDFLVYGCTHFLSGVKCCLFWTWHLWPPNVFRHDVAVPYSTNCLGLLSSPLFWMLTFGASRTFTSLRQTPVLQAPVLARRLSLEFWTLLYDFSEEKGCSVRVDWDTGSLPPPEFRDSRAAAAGFVVDLPWVESFSYRFRHPQHVNLLELEALTSLIRG